jgi:hypothetical protein
MAEELTAMVGKVVYGQLLAYMDNRTAQPKATRLEHPVLRRKA